MFHVWSMDWQHVINNCFGGFDKNDIALKKMMFDGWMPQVNYGSIVVALL
jgi:hypothetical protein